MRLYPLPFEVLSANFGKGCAIAAGVAALFAWSLAAQGTAGSLKGQVTDPSGRVVPDATITLSGGPGGSKSTKSDIQGQYQLRNLPAGPHTVRVTAKGFAPFQLLKYDVVAGQAHVLDISLVLPVESERITVADQ